MTKATKTPASSLLAAAGVSSAAPAATSTTVVLSIADLRAQQEAIATQLAEATAKAQAEALATIKQVMADSGLSFAQVAAEFPGVKAVRPSGTVAAKYKNDKGETWSGRGLQPKWLKNAIAAGATLQSFAIVNGAAVN